MTPEIFALLRQHNAVLEIKPSQIGNGFELLLAVGNWTSRKMIPEHSTTSFDGQQMLWILQHTLREMGVSRPRQHLRSVKHPGAG